MADTALTDLTAISTPATGDVLYIVDVSDTTDDTAGSSRQISLSNLTGGGLPIGTTATQTLTNKTLTSPTITSPTIADVSNITNAAADGSTKGVATFAAADFNAVSGVISLDYTNGQKASTTQAGFLTEIATAAETTTGTDATRAVSPDGLAGSNYGIRVVGILVFDDSTEITTGDGAGDVFFRIPSVMNGWNLIGVAGQVQTAATGTGTETIDIMVFNVTQATDMLTVALTIDEDEVDSSTAATEPTIDTTNDDVTTGDQIRIDIDAVPTTTGGKGLYIELQFQLP